DASDRANARDSRRADHVWTQARRVGVRARPKPDAPRTRPRGNAGRKALGRSRNVLGDRSGGRARGVRAARSRAGALVDSDPPTRPARGATVGSRGPGGIAGEVRARDPPSGAD